MRGRLRTAPALAALVLVGGLCAEAANPDGAPGMVDHARVARQVALARDELARWTGTPGSTPDPMIASAGLMTVQTGVTVSADGRSVTVYFTGRHSSSDQPCGSDYTAEAVESDRAVVVVIVEHRYSGDNDEMCELVGYGRTVTAALSRPLGTRVVLMLGYDTPLPIGL
jgi:hypothetical protein